MCVCHPDSECQKCDMMIKVSSLTMWHFNAAHTSNTLCFLNIKFGPGHVHTLLRIDAPIGIWHSKDLTFRIVTL